MCQTVVCGRLVYARIVGSEMGDEREGGGYSLEPHGTRGGLYSLMENCSSGETSVGMYKPKEAMEKFGSDLLA
jgi:hypothetical protein